MTSGSGATHEPDRRQLREEAGNERAGSGARRRVQLGPELFRFTSKQHWVNKAQSWFLVAGLTEREWIALDSVGRVCAWGEHFTRAEKDGTYPVVVYRIERAATERSG